MNLSGWISKINQDGHVAIGTLVFAVGAAIHIFHGLDVSFVAFTSTVLAFLGGHAWSTKGTTSDAPPDSK